MRVKLSKISGRNVRVYYTGDAINPPRIGHKFEVVRGYWPDGRKRVLSTTKVTEIHAFGEFETENGSRWKVVVEDQFWN